jgi:hypothetical protein
MPVWQVTGANKVLTNSAVGSMSMVSEKEMRTAMLAEAVWWLQ